MLGLDYSFARPNPQSIVDAGYQFVMRYLSPQPNAKNIDKAEADALKAVGLKIGLVWESWSNRAYDGYNAGIMDAKQAQTQTTEIGITEGVIFFAADWDVQPFQFDAVDAYYRGVHSVLGSNTGCYAGFPYLTHALDNGIVTHGWQTEAWSRGHQDPRIDLIQRIKTVTIDGASCDENEAFNTSFLGGNTVSVWDELRTNKYGTTMPTWDVVASIDLHVNDVADLLAKKEQSRVPGSTVQLSMHDAALNADMYGYFANQQLNSLVNTLTIIGKKLTDLETRVAELAAKPSGVTGTFPVTGSVKVG